MDFTASPVSSGLVLVFAFPVVAQLGIRMTPAIARATDLNFRVRFIVFVVLDSPVGNRVFPSGAAGYKPLEMNIQEKSGQAKCGWICCDFKANLKSISLFLTFFWPFS